MSVHLDFHVDDLALVLAEYATVRIERAATSAGFLAAGTSQIVSIPLVAGQADYDYEDPTGTSGDWYRSRYADAAGTSFSVYSPAFQGIPAGLVSLDTALSLLGVAAGSADEDRVAQLLDDVSAEIRHLTRRGLEGTPTTYDEVLPISGSLLRLPRGPLSSIVSIRRSYFDGTLDTAYSVTDWRFDDMARGRVSLYSSVTGWVRVVYTTTGEVPAPIIQACLDWLKARWYEHQRDSALASYSTGGDSESYFDSRVGKPPGNVARTLAMYFRTTAGGVV